jgi:Immunity protein 26
VPGQNRRIQAPFCDLRAPFVILVFDSHLINAKHEGHEGCTKRTKGPESRLLLRPRTSRIYGCYKGLSKPMKLPYSEGSMFLVPLRNGGYARGIVARAGKTGKIVFGYFFGPRLITQEGAGVHDLTPERSILRCMFGDLGLINGEWIAVGQLPNWNRSAWPMPDFVRRDELSNTALLVRYNDHDPTQVEEECGIDSGTDLPADSISGYGSVELKLTKLLSGPA